MSINNKKIARVKKTIKINPEDIKISLENLIDDVNKKTSSIQKEVDCICKQIWMLITLVTDPFIDSNKIYNGVYQIPTISQVDFLLNQMNGGGGGENGHFISSVFSI